jgi:hypothetical protein
MLMYMINQSFLTNGYFADKFVVIFIFESFVFVIKLLKTVINYLNISVVQLRRLSSVL